MMVMRIKEARSYRRSSLLLPLLFDACGGTFVEGEVQFSAVCREEFIFLVVKATSKRRCRATQQRSRVLIYTSFLGSSLAWN